MKIPDSAEGTAPARTRPVLRRLSLFLLALAFAAFATSALAGSYAAKGSFVINDSIPPNSQGNVFSNPRGATERFLCPGEGGGSGYQDYVAGPFHYKVYTFKTLNGWWSGGNPLGFSTCVKVGLLVHSGTAAAALYLYTFNPADPRANFLGSVGGLGAGQGGNFGAGFAASQAPSSFDVIVFETTPNGGASYTLLVEGTGIVMSSSGPTATASLQSFRASSAPKGVLVRWKTRSEQNALGFNLYRGDTKKVRLTRSMVRASGNGRGHTYSYLDRTARKGNPAPYYLEVVQRNGSRIMFGPAFRTAR